MFAGCLSVGVQILRFFDVSSTDEGFGAKIPLGYNR